MAPWTVAHQAPLFMEFSRQGYWSGLPGPPPEDLPNPETEPASPVAPVLGGEFFMDKSPGKLKQQQMLYIEVVERVNPKITHHIKKFFFYLILYLYEMIDVHKYIVIIIS